MSEGVGLARLGTYMQTCDTRLLHIRCSAGWATEGTTAYLDYNSMEASPSIRRSTVNPATRMNKGRTSRGDDGTYSLFLSSQVNKKNRLLPSLTARMPFQVRVCIGSCRRKGCAQGRQAVCVYRRHRCIAADTKSPNDNKKWDSEPHGHQGSEVKPTFHLELPDFTQGVDE